MILFKTITDKFKNLDMNIKRLLHKGIYFSFLLCVFSSILLFTYQYFYEIPTLYYIGLSLFKSSLMFICSFIMFALGFDTIRKQMA